MAKLGPVDGDTHVTTGIVGTYGYAAPEYMATGKSPHLPLVLDDHMTPNKVVTGFEFVN